MKLGAGDPAVLVINAGSSSLKFSVHGRDGRARQVGQVEGLQPGGLPRLCLRGQAPEPLATEPQALPDGLAGPEAVGGAKPTGRTAEQEAGRHRLALQAVARRITDLAGSGPLVAVAHRIVHGGENHRESRILGDADLAALQRLVPLAPLHQPHNLAGVRACRAMWPGLPQIGCFDTAFHAGIAPVEACYALPPLPGLPTVRRYGFHGLSYRHLVDTLRPREPRLSGRGLLAHLGNGASLCATVGGASVASSMGCSTLDGLVMGTRSGSLDPTVLLLLMRAGWDADAIEDLLYRRSGLLGLSGLSADMRELRAATGADPASASAAVFAIEVFVHRMVREAGALVATLGGLDLLAFTGGIGEHDALLRAEVARRLAFLGVRVDPGANAAVLGDTARRIDADGSSVAVWVVPADEGRVAAREAFGCLDPGAPAR